MNEPHKTYLESIINKEILSIDYLAQGQIGNIYKVITSDSNYVLKTSQPSTQLQTEADML